MPPSSRQLDHAPGSVNMINPHGSPELRHAVIVVFAGPPGTRTQFTAGIDQPRLQSGSVRPPVHRATTLTTVKSVPLGRQSAHEEGTPDSGLATSASAPQGPAAR